jgi:hypothetical protein
VQTSQSLTPRPRIPSTKWAAPLLAVTAAALALFGLGKAAFAQKTNNPDEVNRRIEGDWIRLDTSGSGSFDGLSSKFQKAQLTPAGAKIVADFHPPVRGVAFTEDRVHGPGDPYIVVDRPCGGGGALGGGAFGVNPDSNAIHIVEQKDQVIVAPERGGVRRIYTDGRGQPDLTMWTPTASGHGVGHYEGAVLVVDTVGLTPGPVPAGGWRTPETHLAERFEVSADGQHLTIHYTWSDPKIYASPHSYDYSFDRLPHGSYAFEEWCDASDPRERQGITVPQQK